MSLRAKRSNPLAQQEIASTFGLATLAPDASAVCRFISNFFNSSISRNITLSNRARRSSITAQNRPEGFEQATRFCKSILRDVAKHLSYIIQPSSFSLL